MAEQNATLTLPTGEVVELPVLKGSYGPDVIDVSGLLKAGFFRTTRDSCRPLRLNRPLHTSMVTTESYCIAAIQSRTLRKNSNYLETCYLLWYGELPSKTQKQEFVTSITRHTMLNESLAHFFDGFHHNAHPMAMMCGAVGALSAFYHDVMDIRSEHHREIAAHRLVAKMPTLAAMCYKHSIGQPFMYPRNDLSYAANFLYMMFGTPCEDYTVSPRLKERWIVSSSSTRITNKMHPHRQCV